MSTIEHVAKTQPVSEFNRSVYSIVADHVDPPHMRWRRDPVAWARERAGLELWSKQREILDSVAHNANTAVKSAHSTGKSFTASTLVCWWLDVHPVGQARVVTTAPTSKQVDAVLWYEINKLHSRLNLAGHCNIREWWIGKQMVAMGRKPPDHDEAAFQGTHAKYMLVIYDEAYGIPSRIFTEGSSLVSNEYGRQLAIGNPDGAGEFEEMCRPGSGWNVVHVGYHHSPAYTGEKISSDLAENLISKRWVEERRVSWGEESALFVSKCIGDFPTSGDPYSVIQYGWAAACRTLELPEGEPVEAGIDVGAGGDRTVIRERRGMVAGREFVFVDSDPMRSVGKLVEKINEWDIKTVKIDVTGIGWGLAGRLRELSHRHNPTSKDTTHKAEVIRVNFGARPSPGNERQFLNRRAELYWSVGRENSRLKRWDLTNVEDQVIHELTASRYEIMDSYGKIKIEPKSDVIKRLRVSPDRAEALLLAFYNYRSTGRGFTSAASALASTNLAGGIDPRQSLMPS